MAELITKIGNIEYPPIEDYETYVKMKESCHSFSVNHAKAEKWDQRIEWERLIDRKLDELKQQLLQAIDERL